MNIALRPLDICAAIIVAAAFILYGGTIAELWAQGIDFSKGDAVGNGFITWLKKNPVGWFFTAAIIFFGIACAMNRADWMWLLRVAVGAFFAFGVTKLVTYLAKQFA